MSDKTNRPTNQELHGVRKYHEQQSYKYTSDTEKGNLSCGPAVTSCMDTGAPPGSSVC